MFPTPYAERFPTGDLEIVALEPDNFPWIVGQQANFLEPEIKENLCTNPVVPQVRLEPQGLVRFDRVVALVL